VPSTCPEIAPAVWRTGRGRLSGWRLQRPSSPGIRQRRVLEPDSKDNATHERKKKSQGRFIDIGCTSFQDARLALASKMLEGGSMSPLSIATIGFFVILLVVVVAWSPLARGLLKESITRPNEPCTFTRMSGRKVELHRNMLPEDMSPSSEQPEQPAQQIGSSPNFKYALAATFVITLLSLVALVALVFAQPTEQVKSVSGTCEKAFIFGFSALIGLIGGRAIK
jgi:hypothetical protein